MNNNNLYNLKYVKAGKAGKVLSLSREMIEEFQGQHCLDRIEFFLKNNDKDAFVVIGESMAREGVFTGDLLLVSRCDVTELQYGNFLILKVDTNRIEQFLKTNTDLGYKMRKFLLIADFMDSCDELYEKVRLIDENSRYSNVVKIVLRDKYEKAKKELLGENRTLLSVTYTEKGMDYSFHAFKDLYARVDYIYRKEYAQYTEIKRF